mmetsp:Transcript_5918/g.13761  ORF Transcript_5918/g.13761 Transcript_5918/m.13761 type:complete len:264 (+) Transcript_5918:916-1707(+)
MILGSPNVPSCFTFVSPNMLVVILVATGLLIRPWILGNLADEEEDELGTASTIEGLFRCEPGVEGCPRDPPVAHATVGVGGDIFGAAGWRILPHNLLILGNLLEGWAALIFVVEGWWCADRSAFVLVSVNFCVVFCSGSVLLPAVSRVISIASGEPSMFSPPRLAAKESFVVLVVGGVVAMGLLVATGFPSFSPFTCFGEDDGSLRKASFGGIFVSSAGGTCVDADAARGGGFSLVDAVAAGSCSDALVLLAILLGFDTEGAG